MRKYILSVLVFFGLFVLSGCGGGSDNISNGPDTISTAAVEATLNAMEITGDSFNLDIVLTKKVDSSYQIELSNFNLSTDSCTLSQAPVFTPNVLTMDGGVNSSATVNIAGTFDQNCTTTGYTFSATQRSTKDGMIDTRMFSVTYSANDSGSTVTPVSVPSSGFFNATTPLEITQADTPYEIKVQVVEDGYVAVGKTVKVKVFDAIYGTISNPETTTGTDGYAVFNYTSPDPLPANGTSTTLELTHDNGTIITQNIVLNFNHAGLPVDPLDDTVSEMYVTPTSFTVTSPGETQDITIVTVNSQNVGISTNIQLEQPNNGTDYGSFDTTNVTTDATGKAVLQYTAPSDITSLVERNITVTEVSQNISKELNIKFITNTTPGQTTNYEIVADVPGSFAVDSIDTFGIKISEIGNPNNVISNDNVNVVNLTSTFSNMLVFANDTDQTTYTALGENSNIQIKSKTLSGIAIIEVRASIFDGTNNVTITGSIPVTIISGPVTAMSMSYIGSIPSCISTPQLHGDKYLIHAVDKYANPAQEVRITPTLINGRKVTQQNTGQINNPGTPDFSDASVDFIASNVTTEDRLIITLDSNHYDQSYLGNWSLNTITANELEFDEIYTGVTTSGLSYVVGDEKRVLGSDLALAHIVDPTNKYMTDSSGALEVEVCFDPVLAAHTVTLAAHVIDRGVRTGISARKAFRWSDFTSSVTKIDNDGSTQDVSVDLSIGGDIIEPLIDLDVLASSFIVKTEPHCQITTTANSVTTNSMGRVILSVSTDGNTSVTGGVDECTIEWNAEPTSILYEY